MCEYCRGDGRWDRKRIASTYNGQDGNLSFNVDKTINFANGKHAARFKINYCPMCGKYLHDEDKIDDGWDSK